MFDPSKDRYRLRIAIPAFPAFNIYSCIANKTTALGPVCVATAANKMEKWDVEVIDENNLGRFGPRSDSGGADHKSLQSLRPADVVGLYGGLSSTVPRLYRIAQFYKSQGVITVAGGQHFIGDNIEESLSSGIDYIVRGEGEETIKDLIRALETGQDVADVRGIAYLKNGKPVLTASREPLDHFERFPLPDFSLVRYARIKIYPVERIRGCGMDCEFCTVKGRARPAKPERLLDHISSLVETRKARRFFIVDDLFGQQRDETVRLCNMLAAYQRRIGQKLDITVQIRLDKSRDAGLLSAMRGAGIQTVAIGLESPIDEELKAMNKHICSDDMVSMARVFHKFGFLVHGMFIFGYPLKGKHDVTIPLKERVRRYRKFIKKAKIDTVQVLLPVPLPGTELRDRLSRENRIYPLQNIGWEYYDGNFPLFEPDKPLTSEEVHGSAKKIMGRFYQLKYIFLVGAKILSFPSLVFFLHDIRLGWQKWYRSWRNYLVRFGGWITLKKWATEFRRDKFLDKVQNARDNMGQRGQNK